MPRRTSWLSSREAAALLGVKLETLYAYASRGQVASIAGPRGRGRRYDLESLERLKARHDARSGHAAVAAGALRFGEPSLETSVSEIRKDGPYYRGHAALALSEQGIGFEAVFDLLLTGVMPETASSWSAEPLPGEALVAAWEGAAQASALEAGTAPPSSFLAALLAAAALADGTRHGLGDVAEHDRARRITQLLASRVGQALGIARTRAHVERAGDRVAERLVRSLGASIDGVGVEAIDRALVLCADHELNASTFAARVAASTGSDLYACLGAALHTLSGPLHGGASARVEALLREIGEPERAEPILRERRARGEHVPGYGHPIYTGGDPRGRALFALAEQVLAQRAGDGRSRSAAKPKRRAARSTRDANRCDAKLGRTASVARTSNRRAYACLVALTAAMNRAGHPAPNLDAGLVALTTSLELPPGSAAAIFAIGRIPGWVAHALEQRSQRYILRPRARYVPPATSPARS